MPETERTRNCTLIGSVALAVLCAAGVTGCSQLEPVAPTQPVTDPAQLYVRLKLDYPAVNMSTVAPYDAQQLTATPFDGTGAAIAGAPAPTFKVLGDTNLVTVTANGVLHAKAPGTQVKVLASLTIEGVSQADTAVVNIRALDPPPVIDTFTIHVPPDSAMWYVPAVTDTRLTDLIALFAGTIPSTTLSLHVADASGNAVPDLVVDYVSLDTTVAVVNRHTGEVLPTSSGHVRVVARTIAYGVAKADTVMYTVNPPFSADIIANAQGFFNGSSTLPLSGALTIAAGGIVGWFNSDPNGIAVDVVFDSPANVVAPPASFCQFAIDYVFGPAASCAAGNIAPDFNGNFAAHFRQFPVPGTYSYHSTVNDSVGTIIVAPTLSSP